MSNELSTVDKSFDNALQDVINTENLCQKLLQTKHYAKMGQEGVYAIVAKAKSLGISPTEALNGSLYFVAGKVGMSTEMMASLIRAQGHSIVKDAKSNDNCVILHGKRADNGDTWTVKFDIDDAKRADLLKNMYNKYPGIMLYNRAMSMLARQLWPDIIKGAGYTMDELKEIASNNYAAKKEQDLVNVTTGEVIEVQPEIQYITEHQAQTLQAVLSTCDEDYQDKVMSFIKRKPISAHSIPQLPVEYFDRVYNAAVKNSEEKKQRMQIAQTTPSVFDDSGSPD